MAKKLSPWFVVGVVISVSWFAWVIYATLFTEPVNEYESRPSVWVALLLALVPAFITLRVIPRQIEDDGQKWWYPGVIRETAVRWMINVVQVIVALVIVAVGTNIAFFYLSPSEYYGPGWLYEFLARCDTLDAELAIDYQCLDNDDCMMNRNDLDLFIERAGKYELYCVK